ncbi:hypothetical protein [Actinoplanes sp. L3-i22]|uniref:hypothetical protein n=1 Tax=Actinoplanes sp. L3-i22 TaxID=2836373 RepID=UPI001C761AD6|nr:hypothetical protein [Actinoplanes sp. L3-i22]BCY11215.1 hypothetical protein L3i22_063030 [Actinoplanes sp. L3-i22]
MGVIASLYEDEYRPEFGHVVIRDAGDGAGDVRAGLLARDAGGLAGTVARAGAGWLELHAGEDRQRVRIEAHDRAPEPESAGWLDVLETPYRSLTGLLGFTTTTGGPARTGIELGAGPGDYRVRVCRRPAGDEGGHWIVRVWPASPVIRPRWLVRAPDRAGETSASGPRAVRVDDDVFALVSWSPGGRLVTTIARLAGEALVEPGVIAAVLSDAAAANLRVQGDVTDAAAPLELVGVDRNRPGAPVAHSLELPTGDPPRLGYLVGGDITLPRSGAPAVIGRSPLPIVDAMVETAAGVIVLGGVLQPSGDRDNRAALVRWDGGDVELSPDAHDLQISRDGTVCAIYQPTIGDLVLIDLRDGSRETLPLGAGDDELRITGVTADTVWFEGREPMRWSAGDPAPVPAGELPPTSGWDGPNTPRHPHYPARGARRSCGGSGRPAGLSIQDQDGWRRHQLPAGLGDVVDHRLAPLWEDPGHVLLAPRAAGFPSLLLRFDVVGGGYEIAAADLPANLLVWPWPHRPERTRRP